MTNILGMSVLIFFVSIISNLVGFGTGTILGPVLLFFFSFANYFLLVGILQWANSLWKVLLYRSDLKADIIFYLGVPSILGAIVGATLIFYIPVLIFSKVLGIMLILYSFLLLYNPDLKLPDTKLTLMLSGAFSGFSAGFLGSRGPIRSIFLSSLKLRKKEYLATSGAIGFLMDTSRLIIYYMGGMRLTNDVRLSLLIFIPASILGAFCAQFLVRQLSEHRFTYFVAIVLGLVGINLLFC